MVKIYPKRVFKKKAGIIADFQWDIAKQIINAGVGVIIDCGPWSKEMRKNVADRALKITKNIIFHTIILDMNKARERLMKRNAENPRNIVPIDFFDKNIRLYEPITKEEGYIVKRYYQQ